MSNVSLQDYLKTEPDGTLEAIAGQYNTTLLEVVKHLPSHTLVAGDKFDTVWDTVGEWGKVTTLVHSADVILEFTGELPSGFHRHGYFNLRGKKGMKTARISRWSNANLWRWTPPRFCSLTLRAMRCLKSSLAAMTTVSCWQSRLMPSARWPPY